MLSLLTLALKQREMIFPTLTGSKVFCVQYTYDYFEGGSITFDGANSSCMLAAGLEGRIIDKDTQLNASLVTPTAIVARGTFLTVYNCTITFVSGNEANLQSIGFYISGAVELKNATVSGIGQIVKYYENTAISLTNTTLTSTSKNIFPHGKYFGYNVTMLSAVANALTYNNFVKQNDLYSSCPRGTRKIGTGDSASCTTELFEYMQCATCAPGFVHGASLSGGKDESGGCFEPVGVKNGQNCYYTKKSDDSITIRCAACTNGKSAETGCK